jgi:hypothetical protein
LRLFSTRQNQGFWREPGPPKNQRFFGVNLGTLSDSL